MLSKGRRAQEVEVWVQEATKDFEEVVDNCEEEMKKWKEEELEDQEDDWDWAWDV